MNEELITIIIPVYNIETYLPRCLETVAAQTYRNLEIILVDDGSTDTSGAICDDFADKDYRALVIHQHNSGLWAARNTGQNAAHGDYLMFVDGDDYLHLDAVATLFRAISLNPDLDISIMEWDNTDQLDCDIEAKGNTNLSYLGQDDLIRGLFKSDNLYIHRVWNKLFRRRVVESVRSRRYIRCQDEDFLFRVYLNAKGAVWVHRSLYFYVQREDSLMKSPETRLLHYDCVTEMLYRNYVSLPSNKRQYEYLLLRKLHIRMLFYRNVYWKTSKEPEVLAKCRKYNNKTCKPYWLSWRINPLEKIGVTFLLHNPRLTRWLMKVTKNY